MADVSNGKHHDSRGVQAYRWVMVGGMAILSALSLRVLTQIDKTADKVELLQIQVTDMKGTFNSRIDAHVERLNTIDRRNDQQDIKIDDLQRRVWRLPDSSHPATSTPPPPIVPSAPSLEVYPPPRSR